MRRNAFFKLLLQLPGLPFWLLVGILVFEPGKVFEVECLYTPNWFGFNFRLFLLCGPAGLLSLRNR